MKQYLCILMVAMSLFLSQIACSDDIDRDNLTEPHISGDNSVTY